MNAVGIVDILLETGLTPEEFIGSNPEMLHSMTIEYDRIGHDNGVPVYLWSGGMYDYIGTIRQGEKGWYAWEVNPKYEPGGRHKYRYVVRHTTLGSPSEAAAELKQEWEKS